MSCTEGCLTRDHATYAACMRSKGVKPIYAAEAAGRDYTREKRWHRELDAYASARSQGIQPASTSLSATRAAVEISNQTGSAYQA